MKKRHSKIARKGRIANRTDYKSIIGLIIAVALIFIVTYSPHLGYKYPFHVDEWKHIIEAKKIVNHEFTYDENKIELFFDIMLMLLSKAVNLVDVYKFLPAIFWSLAAVFMMIFLRKKISDYAAICCFVFFIAVKTNINILGPWVFTPMFASMFLVFFFLIVLEKIVEKYNRIRACNLILMMMITFLVYPPSAVIEAFVLLFYLDIFRKNEGLPFIITSVFGMLVMLVIFIIFAFSSDLFGSFRWLIDYIVFEKGWGLIEVEYNVIELLGIIPVIFAIIGALFSLKDLKKYKIFLILPIYPMLMIIIFHFFNFTILIPYQRCLLYMSIFLMILAGIGFYHSLKSIYDICSRWLSNKVLLKAVMVMLVLIVLITNIANLNNVPEWSRLLRFVDNEDEIAINILSQQQKGLVIAPLVKAMAIKAMTEHRIVATTYYYGGLEDKKIVDDFFKADCKEKNRIVRDRDILYIYSKEMLNCGFKTLYNGTNVWIYEV